MKDARPLDYWEGLATDGGADETLLDEVRADAPEWDVLGVDVVDVSEAEDMIFLLVFRRKVSDEGHLILSERYYIYDLAAADGYFTGNGIERRVGGSLGKALRVMYAALEDGIDPENPMMLDSRGEGLDHDPDALAAPLDDMLERVDEELGRRDRDDDEREVVDHSDEVVEEDTPTDEVECEKCGKKGPREDMENFGGGVLDAFVHEDGCPE